MSIVFKRLYVIFTTLVWVVMAFAALLTIVSTLAFPMVKSLQLVYKTPVTDCDTQNCNVPGVCVINGTILGSDFRNVYDVYTLPMVSIAFTANFLLMLRIFGCIALRFTTFTFFCLIVFPIRFTFLAMQTLEFTVVGGDYFLLLLILPQQHENCNFNTGHSDAVYLMLLRFICLVVDFLTFHILILTVPLFYLHARVTEKIRMSTPIKQDALSGIGILFSDIA